jgi:hypothetical protein
MACALASPPYYYLREWGGTHERQKIFFSLTKSPGANPYFVYQKWQLMQKYLNFL